MNNESKKRKKKKDNDDDSSDYFNIEDYKITDLKSLINLTYDLINKQVPPKRIKRKLPLKLYKLIDILEPLENLNNLIGLSQLKNQLLDQLLYFVQGNNDNIMLHTVIEGPPGTGKTTIANLMAEIYSGLGILKKNKLNIIKRENLIGQFLGETTIKTMETLEYCKNGVMLIDEAYSLGSVDNRDSYAKEAIDCINQYLTENANKLICIIAGYKEELNECFFSQNKGLRRRFPWTFTIENFTKEELTQIFINKINKTEEYEFDKSIDYKYIESKINKEYFSGNAGDIENIISRIKIINSRINFCKEYNYILTKEIIDEAFDKFYDTRKSNINKVPFMMYS
jgi:replication-associated recombination protein RarA